MVPSATNTSDTIKLANAEAITLSGQVSIRWIENKINQYLNKTLSTEGEDYVIASDTDSIYLNMGPLVSKFFANKSGDKAAIVRILDKICQEKLNHSSNPVIRNLRIMFRHMNKK